MNAASLLDLVPSGLAVAGHGVSQPYRDHRHYVAPVLVEVSTRRADLDELRLDLVGQVFDRLLGVILAGPSFDEVGERVLDPRYLAQAAELDGVLT